MTNLTTIITEDTPVLIVDDNAQFSGLLQRILGQGFGYRDITAVDNTEQALDLIRSEPERFKLLFVDYRFPSGETGGQLLAKLKNEKLLDEKVAFLITSEPSIENQREAQNCGAAGVVAKPFDRNLLRQQLDKAERAIKTDNMNSF